MRRRVSEEVVSDVPMDCSGFLFSDYFTLRMTALSNLETYITNYLSN